MSKHIRFFSLFLMLLASFASAGDAATLDLACSRDRLLDKSSATDPFFVQIQSSDDQVISIKVSMGAWCDARDGQVTQQEISFPCALELAGRRISFSFTLDRVSGAFEQRFFVLGKLQQVDHGICTWTQRLTAVPATHFY
jgi:hypothetical protein